MGSGAALPNSDNPNWRQDNGENPWLRGLLAGVTHDSVIGRAGVNTEQARVLVFPYLGVSDYLHVV